jgi:hypothetical protein
MAGSVCATHATKIAITVRLEIVIADQPAREADQDRREGRQPWRLRHIPDGRGRGATTDVPGNPVADRPKVRLDAGKAARFSAWAQPVDWFDLAAHAVRDLRCPRRAKGRSLAHNHAESGKCRIKAFLPACVSSRTACREVMKP